MCYILNIYYNIKHNKMSLREFASIVVGTERPKRKLDIAFRGSKPAQTVYIKVNSIHSDEYYYDVLSKVEELMRNRTKEIAEIELRRNAEINEVHEKYARMARELDAKVQSDFINMKKQKTSAEEEEEESGICLLF